MKKRFVKLALLSAVLFAAAPAFAQSVDDKIKSLEQELSQLKEQQVELKKEATAAAAALPTFEYRPGNGLGIEAADKPGGGRLHREAHFRLEYGAALPARVFILHQQLSVGNRGNPRHGRLWNGQCQKFIEHSDKLHSAARRGEFPRRESAPLAADRSVRDGSAERVRLKLGAAGFGVRRCPGGIRSSQPQQRF